MTQHRVNQQRDHTGSVHSLLDKTRYAIKHEVENCKSVVFKSVCKV